MSKPDCWMTPDEISEVNDNDCRLVAQLCARLDRMNELLEAVSAQQRAKCGTKCACCGFKCTLRAGHSGPHGNTLHSWHEDGSPIDG